MVLVQEVKGRYFITIPVEKVKRMRLKKGEEVDWDFNDRGHLELSRIEAGQK
jgi:bifunctional DNA-binding transcriptional regulator/antitoxin component of YhaV-PrlF toxin-antitoxin module